MTASITKEQLQELKRLQKKESVEKNRRKKYIQTYKKKLANQGKLRTTVAVSEENLKELQALEATGKYTRALIAVSKEEMEKMETDGFKIVGVVWGKGKVLGEKPHRSIKTELIEAKKEDGTIDVSEKAAWLGV